MEPSGDTHNFGRRVRPVGKDWISKPRSIYWEQLFLGTDSRFRDEVDRIFGDEPIVDCLPRLQFTKSGADPSSTLVERMRVRPAIESCDVEYALEALGGLLAITAWFGMEDLHRSNIALGTDIRTGKFVLAPLDMEVILSDVRIPSTVGLLEASRKRQGLSGLVSMFELIRRLGPRESLAAPLGYMRTSRRLLANARRLVGALKASAGLRKAPIRVLLRDTHDYLAHMRGEPMANFINPMPLSADELVQARRGDVPYFYRTIGDPRIRYFSRPDLRGSQPVRDQAWANARTKAMLAPEQLFAIPERNTLLSEHGAMMLTAYFLPKDFVGRLQYRNLYASAGKRSLQLQFDSGTLFKGPRNWSKFIAPI
jgi:hypothetical protein